MQLATEVSLANILKLISQMVLNEIEELKNKIIKKDNIEKNPLYLSLKQSTSR